MSWYVAELAPGYWAAGGRRSRIYKAMCPDMARQFESREAARAALVALDAEQRGRVVPVTGDNWAKFSGRHR